MGLHEIRIGRNITQRELSLKSGVNFRSLQDYEQGHKKLSSASGDVLLRLSTTLGCSIEELLIEDLNGAPIQSANMLDSEQIQAQRFFCEKYQTFGRWIYNNDQVATLFYYDGRKYEVPFSAIFDDKMLPFLKDAAVMQIEERIEQLVLEKDGFESW